MSKNRKPLVLLSRDMTIEEIQRREAEEKILSGQDDSQLVPPKWIDKTAKKEFERLVIELKKIDFIGNIDLNNLACYCQAFSNYLKATKQLNKEELTVEKHTREGIVIAENPLINIQKKYAEEMRKFGSLCGLSVDARLKIASLKVKEKENDISDEFGDI